jgi:alpha-L-fucosidase 2
MPETSPSPEQNQFLRLLRHFSVGSFITLDAPAADLVAEGTPIGNGRMGMLVGGGIDRESDAICEDSMWSGWANPHADNPEAAAALPEIRRLFAEGHVREAQDLVNRTQVSRMDDGEGHGTYDAYGTYEMLARLEIETDLDPAKAVDYRRDLCLYSAVGETSFELDAVTYTREFFASRPDEAMVMRFTADKPGRITFSATLTRPDTNAVLSVEDGSLLLRGHMNARGGEKGLDYVCRLGASFEGGTMEVRDGRLVFNGCDEVALFITAGTNFKGLGAWPDYLDGQNPHITRTRAQLDAALARGYDALLEAHKSDFRTLFCGVELDLSGSRLDDSPPLPQAEMLKAGTLDPDLIGKYYNFGRYLLISSSREGDLPANLQGLWTVNFQDASQGGRWNYYTPWNGDYHANVNIQMNYWPAFSANLAACAGPFYDLVAALPGPGGETARIQHGCEGWTTHTMNNVWGYTSPGWEASWGHFPMAGPWLATHIWTGYAYTLDRDFLARMWPALRGSAQFVLSWMSEDADGMLVSGPSASPENRFLLPDGSIGYFCMGPSMDQELCAQLLDETLRAASVLGIDDDVTRRAAEALPRIRPVAIGKDGRLMEWTEPYGEPEPGHRHTSHLFGLYPGTTISPETTPELAQAALNSLEYRIAHGGGYTGWSRAMMIAEWARLGCGEKAYENLVALLRDSTLPNLFDTHPPFQIDGNFGAVAAIVEMLMQSRLERDGSATITLLPALPSAWPAGRITQIVAQGNILTDIAWRDSRLESVTLTSHTPIRVRIRCGGVSAEHDLAPAVPLTLGNTLSPIDQ